MTQYIIATGNVGDGHAFHGPFEDMDQAQEWADRHVTHEWWAVDLYEPLEGTHRQHLDTWAMDSIHEILLNDGQPWTSEQIEEVAEVVKQTSRPIPQPDEES